MLVGRRLPKGRHEGTAVPTGHQSAFNHSDLCIQCLQFVTEFFKEFLACDTLEVRLLCLLCLLCRCACCARVLHFLGVPDCACHSSPADCAAMLAVSCSSRTLALAWFVACQTRTACTLNSSLQHLMEILRKARLDSQMLEFFPPQASGCLTLWGVHCV